MKLTIRIGHSDIFGRACSSAEVVQKLTQFDRNATVNLLSRFLFHCHTSDDLVANFQDLAIGELLSEDDMRAVQRVRGSAKFVGKDTVVFSKQQLTLALRLAACACPDDGLNPLQDARARHELGRVLIMLTEQVERIAYSSSSEVSALSGTRRNLMAELMQTSMVETSSHGVENLAHSFHLYLHFLNRLRSDRQFATLEAQFIDRHGIDHTNLFMVLSVAVLRHYRFTVGKIREEMPYFDLSDFATVLSDKQLESIARDCSLTLDQLVDENFRSVPNWVNSHSPFDLKPFLRLGERVLVLPDRDAALKALGPGMIKRWRALNPGLSDSLLGKALNDYAQHVLNARDWDPSKNTVKNDTQCSKGSKRFDFSVSGDGGLVLVEVYKGELPFSPEELLSADQFGTYLGRIGKKVDQLLASATGTLERHNRLYGLVVVGDALVGHAQAKPDLASLVERRRRLRTKSKDRYRSLRVISYTEFLALCWCSTRVLSFVDLLDALYTEDPDCTATVEHILFDVRKISREGHESLMDFPMQEILNACKAAGIPEV